MRKKEKKKKRDDEKKRKKKRIYLINFFSFLGANVKLRSSSKARPADMAQSRRQNEMADMLRTAEDKQNKRCNVM